MNSQQSLYDQLRELIQIANKNGLYDAADYIRHMVEQIEEKERGKREFCGTSVYPRTENSDKIEVKDETK